MPQRIKGFPVTLILLLAVNNVNAQFHVSYTCFNCGSSTTISSTRTSDGGLHNGPFVNVSPQTLQGITRGIQRGINMIEGKLYEYDANSQKAVTIVSDMHGDSISAARFPQAMNNYEIALKGYKSLEPLSEKIWGRYKKIGGNLVFIYQDVNNYLEQQKAVLASSEIYYKRGKAISELGKNYGSDIKKAFGTYQKDNSISETDLKGLKKNKADILFAQNQISKLTFNKSKLLAETELARSKRLQYAATIALSLKSTSNLVQGYLSAIAGTNPVATIIDVSEAFIEKAVEERIINNKSFESSFKEAFKAAYIKASIEAYSSKKFPISELSVIPYKISQLIDDIKTWQALYDNPVKARNLVNEQILFIERAIAHNQSIIDKASQTAKTSLYKYSKQYLLPAGKP